MLMVCSASRPEVITAADKASVVRLSGFDLCAQKELKSEVREGTERCAMSCRC